MNSSEVEVWPIDLNVSDVAYRKLVAVLTEDERARAERFVFEKHQRAFAVCRGALRTVLENYLGVSSADIRFQYSERGKPSLAMHGDLCFNVSHSGDLAVFAFARGCEIGIDIEALRPMADIHGIAKRFFCPEECAELMSLPDEERSDAFLRCWTRKEAFIKATGKGLMTPLDQFRVTFQELDKPQFVHIHGDIVEAAQWTIQKLELDAAYVGAVAYKAPPKHLRIRADLRLQ